MKMDCFVSEGRRLGPERPGRLDLHRFELEVEGSFEPGVVDDRPIDTLRQDACHGRQRE